MKTSKPKVNSEAYRRLADEARKSIELLAISDLMAISKAINPALPIPDIQASIAILVSEQWEDGWANVKEAGHCRVEPLHEMRVTLYFHRQQVAVRFSNCVCTTEVKMVYQFSRPDGTRSWLDCETGLPWVPPGLHWARRGFSLEMQQALGERDAMEMEKAIEALQAIKKARMA